MRRLILSMSLGMAFLVACAKDPVPVARELIRKNDYLGAITLLEEAEPNRPEDRALHYQLFVLYRYLGAQGEASKQDLYAAKAIRMYDWICKVEKIDVDYGNLEESLRRAPASRPRYEEARRPVYVR